MAESEGRRTQHDPKARRILALHAEHRRGLHDTPVADCIQCTFDGLVRRPADEEALPGPETP